jgi:parallel beta-helix repeat protein
MICSRALNKKIILFAAVFFFLMINGVYAKNFEVNKIDSIFNNFYSTGFTNKNHKSVEFFDERIGMANPAAVYCHELGYEYKIVDTDQGQKGVCIFPDKSECEEWEFLIGKCGQSYSYCTRQGYDLIIKTDGKNPFSREYAVCAHKGVKIGSVTDLFSLSEKATKGTFSTGVNSNTTEKVSTMSLPSSFDWRNYQGQDWMTPVKNQGQCGSCWAFSAVGVVEPTYNIYVNDPNLDLDLSEEYIVSDCSDAGNCCGGWHDDALIYIRDNGIPDENCMPYVDGTDCTCYEYPTCDDNCNYRTGDSCSDRTCSDRCSDWQSRLTKIRYYGTISNIQSEIKSGLIDHGPLSVAMGILDEFGGYWDGDIYRCADDSEVNHAVIIAGYNDTGNYWIVKNSWGDTWNGDGYFKVGYGECSIEDYVYYAKYDINCGDTVVTNTKLYKDLVDCPSGNGLTIGANNITLDCNGHTIDAISGGNGIYSNKFNTRIKNCVLKDWSYGIKYEDSNNGLIENITARNSSSLYFNNSNYNILSYITVSGIYDFGLYLSYSNYNILSYITANNNTGKGLYLFNSNYNTIKNSNLFNNTEWDFYISGNPVGSNYCNNELINVTGTENKPIVYYNSSIILENWYNNASEIVLCNADNSLLNNIIMNGTTLKNNRILLVETDDTNLTDIDVTGLMNGINLVSYSERNTLKNITANKNNYGLSLFYSNNNILTNITTLNNGIKHRDWGSGGGIKFYYSSKNSLFDNKMINDHVGIDLTSSSDNIIYRNYFDNNQYGVRLGGSNNNTISNNNIIRTTGIGFPTTGGEGIYLAFSNNNTIFENNMSDNYKGIGLEGTMNNKILNNNITKSYGSGIWLYFGCCQILSGNNIANGSWWGIIFEGAGGEHIVSMNNITNNAYGVRDPSSSTFYNNNIVNNGLHSGMQVAGNNIFYNNNIVNNDISVGGNNNIFFHNNIINSVTSVRSGYANVWNDGYPSGGNYWSNYTGLDLYNGPYQNETGSDGIGDTNYTIDANNTDRYPFMTESCWLLPPTITILSPQSKTYYTTSVPLTFTVNEPTSWCGYSLDGQANVTLPGCVNITLTGLSYTTHNIIVYANDTLGNMGFSEKRYFTVSICTCSAWKRKNLLCCSYTRYPSSLFTRICNPLGCDIQQTCMRVSACAV